VNTTRSVHELAEEQDMDLPITAEVHQVLFAGKSPVEATASLMLRPPREE
jgi:glycerol-3-phosphate dehydrogenase (NAD(P)+)